MDLRRQQLPDSTENLSPTEEEAENTGNDYVTQYSSRDSVIIIGRTSNSEVLNSRDAREQSTYPYMIREGKFKLVENYDVWINEEKLNFLSSYPREPKEVTHELLEELLGPRFVIHNFSPERGREIIQLPGDVAEAIKTYILDYHNDNLSFNDAVFEDFVEEYFCGVEQSIGLKKKKKKKHRYPFMQREGKCELVEGYDVWIDADDLYNITQSYHEPKKMVRKLLDNLIGPDKLYQYFSNRVVKKKKLTHVLRKAIGTYVRANRDQEIPFNSKILSKILNDLFDEVMEEGADDLVSSSMETIEEQPSFHSGSQTPENEVSDEELFVVPNSGRDSNSLMQNSGFKVFSPNSSVSSTSDLP